VRAPIPACARGLTSRDVLALMLPLTLPLRESGVGFFELEGARSVMGSKIHVYGADWCGLTFRVREYLIRERFSHEYHNVERDQQAAEFVRSLDGTTPRFPLVVIEDTVVICPTIEALRRLIDAYRVQPAARRARPA